MRAESATHISPGQSEAAPRVYMMACELGRLKAQLNY